MFSDDVLKPNENLFEEASLIEIPPRTNMGDERSTYRTTILDFHNKEFKVGKIVCEFAAEARTKAHALKAWCKPEDRVKILSRRNIVYLIKE